MPRAGAFISILRAADVCGDLDVCIAEVASQAFAHGEGRFSLK